MAIDVVANVSQNYEQYKEYFADSADTAMNMDTFLQLLVAEMSNQDPMEPTSNTEFIAQMAQMSSLQAMQDLTYYANASFSASMIGQTVSYITVNDSGEYETGSGVVTGITLNGQEFQFVVDGKTISFKNIMEIGVVPKTGETDEGDETDGTGETDEGESTQTDETSLLQELMNQMSGGL